MNIKNLASVRAIQQGKSIEVFVYRLKEITYYIPKGGTVISMTSCEIKDGVEIEDIDDLNAITVNRPINRMADMMQLDESENKIIIRSENFLSPSKQWMIMMDLTKGTCLHFYIQNLKNEKQYVEVYETLEDYIQHRYLGKVGVNGTMISEDEFQALKQLKQLPSLEELKHLFQIL